MTNQQMLEDLNEAITSLEARVARYQEAYAQIDAAFRSISGDEKYPDEMWLSVRWLSDQIDGMRERLQGLIDRRDLLVYRSQQAEATAA